MTSFLYVYIPCSFAKVGGRSLLLSGVIRYAGLKDNAQFVDLVRSQIITVGDKRVISLLSSLTRILEGFFYPQQILQLLFSSFIVTLYVHSTR